MTKNIIRSITAEIPLAAAYDIWSRFEDYSRFLKHVIHARISGRDIRWKTSRGGQVVEWDAQIIELTPPRRIAWVTYRDGYPQYVVVTLQPDGEQKTEVTLASQYQFLPGDEQQLGDALDSYLQQFKIFAEAGKAKLPQDVSQASDRT